MYFLPTRRDLAWFACWTIGVLLLIYFVPKSRQSRVVEPEQQPIRIGEIKPARSFASLVDEVRSQPAQIPQPRAAATETLQEAPWSPLTDETAGDARKVFPEQVTWLKEQLRGAIPNPGVMTGTEMERTRRLVRWVGDMPYVRQPHWELPTDTVEKKVGDCKTKSLMLAVSLLTAGIKEVAISRGVPPNYRPGQDGHAWVQVMLGGERWLIEATNGTMQLANSKHPGEYHVDRS